MIVAAFATMCVSSCVKEDLYEMNGPRAQRTFRCTFADVTKTALTDEGKTVWSLGDSIWVSNGKDVAKVGVPAEADGQKTFEFHLDLCDSSSVIYAVYPASAAAGLSGDKVEFVIPTIQDGSFSSANISVAKATTNEFAFKNVTSIFKVSVPDETLVGVQSVAINTAGNVIAGKCSVDLSGDAPVVTPMGTATGVVIEVNGTGGYFYASAAAGTYKAGMTITAVGTELACHTKTLDSDKELAVNYIVNLGTIGDQMSSVQGEGTESSPYTIGTLAELLAFTYYVNNGNAMTGEYVKLTADIEGVTAPIGAYSEADEVHNYFRGDFDGASHTLTLAMSGDGRTALFGDIASPAKIHDLTVAGTVNSVGNTAAGVVARAVTLAPADEGTEIDSTVVISNCVNKANVNGKIYTAGILGYGNAAIANAIRVTNCSNEGAIAGSYDVGGIAGYVVLSKIDNCANSGVVSGDTACGMVFGSSTGAYAYVGDLDNISTKYGYTNGKTSDQVKGQGGIAGVLYNSSAVECENTGSVSGVQKVGGIAGALYWASVTGSSNSAAVSVSKDIVGGIAGYLWVQSTINDCENTGAVTGRAAIGGILGLSNSDGSSPSPATYMTVMNSVNKGTVSSNIAGGKTTFIGNTLSNLSAAGGILGYNLQTYTNGRRLRVTNCVNEAAVYGVGQGVGGIVGLLNSDRGNCGPGIVDACVNNGEVSSDLYRAGGIVGINLERYVGTTMNQIRNCTNTAKVSAPVSVGGILGYGNGLYPTTDASTYKVQNCLNTGDVYCSLATPNGHYAGGLLGLHRGGLMDNCYTCGELTVATPADELVWDHLGKLVGDFNSTAWCNYVYCPFEEGGILYGTVHAANGKVTNAAMEDAGQLDIPVTIADTEYEVLLDALNAWVDNKNGETGTTYYHWEEGPKLVPTVIGQ